MILLTETAVDFFARQGYRVVERSTAPPNMQECEEFRLLCPSFATCMAKNLQPAPSAADQGQATGSGSTRVPRKRP